MSAHLFLQLMACFPGDQHKLVLFTAGETCQLDLHRQQSLKPVSAEQGWSFDTGQVADNNTFIKLYKIAIAGVCWCNFGLYRRELFQQYCFQGAKRQIFKTMAKILMWQFVLCKSCSVMCESFCQILILYMSCVFSQTEMALIQ